MTSIERKDGRRSRRYLTRLKATLSQGTISVGGATVDVSRHGVFLETMQPPRERFLLRVTLELPDGPLEANAFVARRVTPESGLTPGVGLQFFAMGEQTRARWDRYMATLSGAGQLSGPEQPVASFVVKLTDETKLRDFFLLARDTGSVYMVTPLVRPVGTSAAVVLVHPTTQREFILSGSVGRVRLEPPKGIEIRLLPMSPPDLEAFERFMLGERWDGHTPMPMEWIDDGTPPPSPELLDAMRAYQLPISTPEIPSSLPPEQQFSWSQVQSSAILDVDLSDVGGEGLQEIFEGLGVRITSPPHPVEELPEFTLGNSRSTMETPDLGPARSSDSLPVHLDSPHPAARSVDIPLTDPDDELPSMPPEEAPGRPLLRSSLPRMPSADPHPIYVTGSLAEQAGAGSGGSLPLPRRLESATPLQVHRTGSIGALGSMGALVPSPRRTGSLPRLRGFDESDDLFPPTNGAAQAPARGSNGASLSPTLTGSLPGARRLAKRDTDPAMPIFRDAGAAPRAPLDAPSAPEFPLAEDPPHQNPNSIDLLPPVEFAEEPAAPPDYLSGVAPMWTTPMHAPGAPRGEVPTPEPSRATDDDFPPLEEPVFAQESLGPVEPEPPHGPIPSAPPPISWTRPITGTQSGMIVPAQDDFPAVEDPVFLAAEDAAPPFLAAEDAAPPFLAAQNAAPPFLAAEDAAPPFLAAQDAAPPFPTAEDARPFLAAEDAPRFLATDDAAPSFPTAEDVAPSSLAAEGAALPSFLAAEDVGLPSFLAPEHAPEPNPLEVAAAPTPMSSAPAMNSAPISRDETPAYPWPPGGPVAARDPTLYLTPPYTRLPARAESAPTPRADRTPVPRLGPDGPRPRASGDVGERGSSGSGRPALWPVYSDLLVPPQHADLACLACDHGSLLASGNPAGWRGLFTRYRTYECAACKRFVSAVRLSSATERTALRQSLPDDAHLKLAARDLLDLAAEAATLAQPPSCPHCNGVLRSTRASRELERMLPRVRKEATLALRDAPCPQCGHDALALGDSAVAVEEPPRAPEVERSSWESGTD